jgi:L-amino acid N-acyltransferase YncA
MHAQAGEIVTRQATPADMQAVTAIYNQGIEDRIATLETDVKSEEEVTRWLCERPARYEVLVADSAQGILGWAALNPYSHRCAYAGVADLSIYVERGARGKGVGAVLLAALEERARAGEFHKIVLFTFPFNAPGQALYRKRGFREVGTFKEQGRLDGKPIDVMVMEKILVPAGPAAPANLSEVS